MPWATRDAGVVHRDLKPDNILLDGTRTVITDFGIARPLEHATTLTLPGTMIGTPAFIAPGQIEGKQATAASDLWSLGVTLYAAVEGTLPFEGETITQMCLAILTRPMRPPRNAGPLTSLLHALLTKDPVERATAETAAAYLAAMDDAGPTAAEPPTVTDVETRTSVHTDMPPVGEDKATIRLDDRPGTEPGSPEPGGLERSGTRRWPALLAGSLVGIGVAVAITVAALEGSPGATPHASATTGAPQATLKAKFTSPDKSSAPDDVAFSPNGTSLATAAENGGIHLWDTATGKLTETLTSPDSSELANPNNSATQVVSFSPSGTTLATADGNSNTYLWNTGTGKLTATLTDPNPGDDTYSGAGICAVAFSPNGTTLAAADRSGNIYLWGTATEKPAATLTDPNPPGDASTGGVGTMAFAPNGTTLAVGDTDGSTYVWNTATEKLAATLAEPDLSAAASGTGEGATEGAVAFAPNGIVLAVGDGNTYLWDVVTGKLTATLTEPKAADDTEDAGVDSLAFAPNGTTLAVGGGDADAYLWDTTTDKLTATLTDDGPLCCGSLTTLAFAPNGSTLATAYSYGDTDLWHVAEQKP